AIVAFAQWNFTVDTTFQAEVEGKNINDLMVMPDGKIFLSGRIRFLGDDFDRGSSKLLANGARDMSFPSFPETTGGGKITPWENSFYVSNGLVRRLNSDGLIDPAFISLNLGLYFYSLQGGDYHVFPDGRVLISGNHLLSDSVRGFEGLYQLVWFTNTGYLDTTRIHRSSGNCAVYRFEELPSGQFIVRGICDQFDGQPVDRIFRVHADGSVDTSYHTGVYWGAAYDYLPLADGRVYVAGEYLRTAEPGDTLHLARFLSTGQLDPSFLPPQFTMLSSLATFGCGVERIEPWLNGTLLATGQFSSVNGQPRNGICILDTNGTLLPAFGGQGVGTYTESFSGGSYRYATIAATAYDSTNAHLYIAGAYSGYTDATGHYPDQRFITRLKVSELSTAVPDQAPQRGSLQLWPNPAAGQVWLRYALPGHQGQVHLRVRDSQGRVLFLTPAAGEEGQVVWDSRGVAPGVYTVELLREGKLERSERLIIQP
ncbi:MAG TPA: delta-60 repeat domain-containing protein, partial [Flavobacteriales bacterium]|nr:delta-60 repeat domain-containing protein [Flavobacteriales bacterium]